MKRWKEEFDMFGSPCILTSTLPGGSCDASKFAAEIPSVTRQQPNALMIRARDAAARAVRPDKAAAPVEHFEHRGCQDNQPH
jgi:hypothetical protein